MKNTCETLTELSNAIKKIIDAYHDKRHDDVSSSCYFDFPIPLPHERDEILQKHASDVRTCALDIFEQNPDLPKLPPPLSEPLSELQQIRQWCIRAEAPEQEKDGQGKKKKPRRPQKHSEDKIKAAQTLFDELQGEGKSVRECWFEVHKKLGFKSPEAAKQAVYRYNQQNKKQK